MVHPRHRLDEAFQTPVRFSLMAALGRRTEIDFPTLRDVLETEDSVLSKAISSLQRAGYVKVTKGYAGNRPRTWIEATTTGHRAYQAHLLALRAITEGLLDEPGQTHGSTPKEPPTDEDEEHDVGRSRRADLFS